MFFEAKPTDGSVQVIDVIWDDEVSMAIKLKGNSTEKNGLIYPKQMSTYRNKSELGIYIRNIISAIIERGLVFGDTIDKSMVSTNHKYFKDRLITKDDLERYGRFSIDMQQIDDNLYRFDFSPSAHISEPINTKNMN